MRKTLDFAKDNAKKIKQDKIGPYKYDSPQIMGYNVFGWEIRTQIKALRGVVLQGKRHKMARNHNK